MPGRADLMTGLRARGSQGQGPWLATINAAKEVGSAPHATTAVDGAGTRNPARNPANPDLAATLDTQMPVGFFYARSPRAGFHD
ncbi:hypothetical protein CBM2586_A10461 [Cupriavidus phytorum]|uniref:Uncharacterized protein n=1 Tax=Cupriavidus taiwanensis TaxID=164546 RepID=A0A375BA14_9BURK|nr:hypothetical protein CBM2586_A10461 [Cupriavidus taiwanensis]